MPKEINIKVLMLCFLSFLMVSFSRVSAAEETNMDVVGYSVEAVIPNNQIDKQKTYFDLMMEARQKQELTVAVYNNTNESITVNTAITNAYTNSNGLIVYDERKKPLDDSLELPLTELAKVDDQLTIEAGGTEYVTIQLTMPNEAFDGIVLGGILFEKENDNQESEASGFGIENRYAYVIGIQLRESEVVVTPELVLKDIKTGLENYRTAVTAIIQNPTARIISGLTLEGFITKIDDADSEFEKKALKEDIRLAPNSTMDFIIDWENEPLEEGIYEFSGRATTEEDEWLFEREFEIKNDEARLMNKEAVNIERDYTPWIIGLFVVLILIIIVLVVLLMKKKK